MRALVSPWIANNEVGISIVSYGEVIEALRRFPDFTRRRRELRELLQGTYRYPLNYRILERYTDLRRQLRPPYGSGLIGDIDTIIAATALEYDLTLITMDGDFRRVPDLKHMVLARRP